MLQPANAFPVEDKPTSGAAWPPGGNTKVFDFKSLAPQYHLSTTKAVFSLNFVLNHVYLMVYTDIYGHTTIFEGWHFSTTMAPQYHQVSFWLYLALNNVYFIYSDIYSQITISDGWHISANMATQYHQVQ